MPLASGASRGRWRSLVASVGIACALASTAHAQDAIPPAMDAPWSDVAPAIDAANERVVAAAVGIPDERLGRLAARRDDARRSGEERARRSMHAWADDALARITAAPSIAAAVHRAIDAGAEVTRVRALSDGGAVIEIAIPLAALRSAAPSGGLPWSR